MIHLVTWQELLLLLPYLPLLAGSCLPCKNTVKVELHFTEVDMQPLCPKQQRVVRALAAISRRMDFLRQHCCPQEMQVVPISKVDSIVGMVETDTK
jgi:hypothetical protein